MQILESNSTRASVSEKWVDIATVADHLGFSVKTIRRWAKSGLIVGHPIRNGARTFYRFKRSEVDAALKAGRRIIVVDGSMDEVAKRLGLEAEAL